MTGLALRWVAGRSMAQALHLAAHLPTWTLDGAVSSTNWRRVLSGTPGWWSVCGWERGLGCLLTSDSASV